MPEGNQAYTPLAEEVLAHAREDAQTRKHRYIGTEHLLLGIMKTDCLPSYLLSHRGVTREGVLELLERLVQSSHHGLAGGKPQFSPRAREVLERSQREAQLGGKEYVGTEHIFMALLKDKDSVVVRLLSTMEISPARLLMDLYVAMGEDGISYREEMEGHRGMSAGEGTPTLDQFSRDLTALARQGALDPMIGRKQELDRLIRTLSRRTKNNPCLVGEPGVGKTAIVEGLAQRMVSGQVPDILQGKRLLALDLSGMVAGTEYRGEFEERMKLVIQEAFTDGNTLLFLDEIHTLIGAGGAEGALDAANILKPALSRGEIQLIGATTREEYRKHIEKDPALERRFQSIVVEEPDMEESIAILQGLKTYYEKHHRVVLSPEAIFSCVQLSSRYFNERCLPDKALDLLDEASARVALSQKKNTKRQADSEAKWQAWEKEKEIALQQGDFDRVLELRKLQQKKKEKREKHREKETENLPLVVPEDVAAVVAEWTKIPVQQLTQAETVRLQKLEEIIHRRVIGQEEAVSAIARSLRRSRVGLKDPHRPIGSFLFLGPTGVGKTELAKALAQAMFDSEDAMIRVDMSEYMEKHSISKLIGSPPGYVGYEEAGQLSEKVRRNPYSVILFDEMEKAHPDVFHILLQVLDDGHITDAQGRKISFKNTILIMTSNAGAQRIVEPKKLGFSIECDQKEDYRRMRDNVMEEVKRIFRPEFLNRIDDILVFHGLDKGHMQRILQLMLRQTEKRIQENQGIELRVTPSALDRLLEKGYDPKYGARPLRRALQTELEDPLAEEILSGHIKSGERVSASYLKGKWRFTSRPMDRKSKDEGHGDTINKEEKSWQW